MSDCKTGNPNCKHGSGNGLIEQPQANGQGPGTLDYVPALIGGTANGVPSCATGSPYQEADRRLRREHGVRLWNSRRWRQADLTFNPGKASGDTTTATECLIHQSVGQDVMDTTVFPFQIQAGLGNPVLTNALVTSSNSIVTVPIYDDVAAGTFTTLQDYVPVNIVGFLQVFINGIDAGGNINVTVLNVAGCSNTATNSTPTATGSSPCALYLAHHRSLYRSATTASCGRGRLQPDSRAKPAPLGAESTVVRVVVGTSPCCRRALLAILRRSCAWGSWARRHRSPAVRREPHPHRSLRCGLHRRRKDMSAAIPPGLRITHPRGPDCQARSK